MASRRKYRWRLRGPALPLLAALLAAAPAGAEERLLLEETFLSVEIKGQPFRLEALVAREAGVQGRLPVALITHGQSAELEQRERMAARRYLPLARDMARRGYLAVVVVRRGFGRSEGRTPYALRGCRDGDYAPALDDQTDDIEAAVKAVARRADADAGRMIALGVSVGGATMLNFAARVPEGLKAVVNLSGGIRSQGREGGPPVSCQPEDLVPLFSRLGGRTKTPSLWLYAENDSLFPADYVRRLHEAYVVAGGGTQFHMFEPIEGDGHNLAGRHDGMLRWIPALDRFLRDHKLPTYDPAPLDALPGRLKAPPATRLVFVRYHGRPTEKAIAVSASGRTINAQFGLADLAEVEAKAKAGCEAQAKEPCRIVARNFEVVEEAVGKAP